MDNNILGFICVFTVLIIASLVAGWMEYKIEQRARRVLGSDGKPVRVCPPHLWETLGQPGVPGAEFMRCKRCGRLPSAVTGEEMYAPDFDA